MSDHVKSTQAKFFENIANQGDRIGKLTLDLKELDHEHTERQVALKARQLSLFKSKNVAKWENPDAARLPKAD